MKLWEAMKALEDNKDKKFVFDNGDRIYTMSIDRSCGSKYFHLSAINDKGRDISHLDSGGFDENFTVDDEWEEAKQSVTWQEAIQAWIDGKKVVCNVGGCEYIYLPHSNGRYDEMVDQCDDRVDLQQLTRGKWYVE